MSLYYDGSCSYNFLRIFCPMQPVKKVEKKNIFR